MADLLELDFLQTSKESKFHTGTREHVLAWRDRMQRARAWIQSAPELAPNMQFPEGHAVDTTDESVWPRFFRRLCFWPASSRDRGLGHLLQPDKLKITELKQVSEATAYDRRMGG